MKVDISKYADVNYHITLFTFLKTLIVIVKLRSDLRILTQLQLVGVGVEFVFPLKEEEGRKEGRRRITLT